MKNKTRSIFRCHLFKSSNNFGIIYINMWNSTMTTVLDTIVQISGITNTIGCKIEGTITEETIEFAQIFYVMARKILTIMVLEEFE